jgi:kynurenine formamidase
VLLVMFAEELCERSFTLDLSHSVSPSSPTFRAGPSITELGGIEVAGRWDLQNLASATHTT